MMHYLSGRKTGVYYVDSTHFSVCKNIRISNHKTFKNLAARGHSSIDWFYGFKLHMIINDKSEIVAIKITAGNIDDRKAFQELVIKKGLKGKCYADKGYSVLQLTVFKMEVGPPQSVFRNRLQTTVSCYSQKLW
jgi:IS5 family transposase